MDSPPVPTHLRPSSWLVCCPFVNDSPMSLLRVPPIYISPISPTTSPTYLPPFSLPFSHPLFSPRYQALLAFTRQVFTPYELFLTLQTPLALDLLGMVMGGMVMVEVGVGVTRRVLMTTGISSLRVIIKAHRRW